MPTVTYKDGAGSTRHVAQANPAADGTTAHPDWPQAEPTVGGSPVSAANPLPASPAAAAAGGATPWHLVSAAGTNATVAKAAPGQLYSLTLVNYDTAAPALAKFYDSSTTPDPAADAPHRVFTAPAAVSATQPTVVEKSLPMPVAFTSGVAFALVQGAADADATPVGAGKVTLDFEYK